MRVKSVMKSDVDSCGPDTDLASAARIMWEKDRGAIPVLDGVKVVGMITDRDIRVALGANGQSALSTTVDKIMSAEVHDCSPEDNLKTALKRMRRQRVRRLPVINADGGLVGILSITDIALNAGKPDGKKRRGPSYRSIFDAYRRICKRQSSKQ